MDEGAHQGLRGKCHKMPSHGTVVLWMSTPLSAGLGDRADVPSAPYSLHRTTAGRVAGNPARFSCLVSGFKAPPLQSFHCVIFHSFHRLLKLTESMCSVVTFFSCCLRARSVLPSPGSNGRGLDTNRGCSLGNTQQCLPWMLTT